MAGQPLAGGFICALVQVLGDWKWLKEAFQLSQNYNCRACCHLCRAVKYGEGPAFDDFGRHAAHRGTERSFSDYIKYFSGRSIPWLALLPGFTLSMLVCDPMHAIHLGVLQWACGSLLVVLSGLGVWGSFIGTQKQKLDAALRVAFGQFKRWCQRQGVHTSQLLFTAARVNRGDDNNAFPVLACKAANAKWITYWLSDVLWHRGTMCLEAAVFWGLAEMLHIMSMRVGPWLTQATAARFQSAGRVALVAYAELAREAKRNRQPLWVLKPKHHQVDHLCTVVAETCLHPGYAWAFADEDFNGRLMKIARSCCAPHKFSATVLEKYILGVYIGLQGKPQLPWG